MSRRIELSAKDIRCSYRHTSFADRSAKLLRAASLLEAEKWRFGALMTAEMGKTIGAAEAEAKKCALACRYYAETGEQALADEIIHTEASRCFIRYQPIGPVLAVMPWNFPFLASDPVRGAGLDGGQYLSAETRVERSRMRDGD